MEKRKNQFFTAKMLKCLHEFENKTMIITHGLQNLLNKLKIEQSIKPSNAFQNILRSFQCGVEKIHWRKYCWNCNHAASAFLSFSVSQKNRSTLAIIVQLCRNSRADAYISMRIYYSALTTGYYLIIKFCMTSMLNTYSFFPFENEKC